MAEPGTLLVDAGEPPPWSGLRQARRFCWTALDKATRRKLYLVTAASASLAILDFLGVLMFAALAGLVALSLSDTAVDLPIPDFGLPFERLIIVLGLIASVLLALKSAGSWWANRRMYLFTARRKPQFAGLIYRRYMGSPYPLAQTLTVQQVVNAVQAGSGAMVSILRDQMSLVTEVVLLVLLGALMLVASPLLFFGALAYFGIVAWIIGALVGRRASRIGEEQMRSNVEAAHSLSESVGFAPEVRLYGMADAFAARLRETQTRVAYLNAMQQSWFQAPRYVLETALVLGFALVATVAFTTQEPDTAAFVVGLFVVTSARMVPAIQRINGVWGNLRLSTGQMWSLKPVLRLPEQQHAAASWSPERPPEGTAFQLVDVGYRYPKGDVWALRGVTLTVPIGARVALVGSTGAGKSTLAELLLGLLEPTEGRFMSSFTASHGSDVAFVPQDVFIAPDSVRNNVALSAVGEPADDELIWEALRAAQVADVVEQLPDGLDTRLGERGARLSGGEVQRLGIARALYRRPHFLVLDEATSSLDANTETQVAQAMSRIPGGVTVVTIAHRLATVQHADIVVLLDQGRVLGVGSFGELVADHEGLRDAAQLQGLTAASPLPAAEGQRA